MTRLALLAIMALTACATSRPALSEPAPTNWKRVATPDDLGRLHGWRDAFVKGLAQARAGGNSTAIDREGALLQPDAGLEPVDLPHGQYKCRVIKLGTASGTGPAYAAYPGFDCRLNDEGEVDSFNKMNGSQRPMGLVFDDGPARKIFLGTMMLGDEVRPFDYGVDRDRDIIGAFQRVGPRRWRLLAPYPRYESLIDIIELTPAQP